MDEKSLFTKFWTNESATTRKVLARIPDGSDYRPDPKSRTAHEIAWQIVCEEKMIIEALENGEAEWAPPPTPATMKEVLEAYEKQSAGIDPALEGTARRALGRNAGIFWQAAPRVADGLGLSLRHRSSPRADLDVPAADGIDGAADLRAKRGRAVASVHRSL